MPSGRLTPGRIWTLSDVDRTFQEQLEEAYRILSTSTTVIPSCNRIESCVSGLKILAEKEKKICEDKST